MTSSNNDFIFVAEETTLYTGSFNSTNRVFFPNYFVGFNNLFVAIESSLTATIATQVQLELFCQINFKGEWVTIKRESFNLSCIPQKKSYNLIKLPSEKYLRNVLGAKVNTECLLTLILYP